MEKEKMNKKGQLESPIVTLIVVVVAILIIGLFMMKYVNVILTPFATAIGNVSTTAGSNVTHIQNVFVSFWDWVLIVGFLVNVILLFVSAFLVSVHPVFMILYIIFGFVIFMFAPELISIIDKFYADPNFALEVTQLPMMDFLRQYFGLIMLGIYFVSGVILFSRVMGGRNTQ
jgi:hypothetical protein